MPTQVKEKIRTVLSMQLSTSQLLFKAMKMVKRHQHLQVEKIVKGKRMEIPLRENAYDQKHVCQL